MLLSALFSGSIIEIVVTLVAAVFLVFVCIPLHEVSHAFVAYKLGDKSIKYQGRLTLDPLAHIDPVGAVMIALIGFGWGKPCPVDSRNFKKPKRDLALVAAAGPLSNLVLGFVFLFFYAMVEVLFPNFANIVLGQAVGIFLYTTAQISIWLGVLNLLPIPMFDGFTILRAFLKPETEYKILANQQIISLVIIILLFSGILTTPISWVSSFLIKFFYFISALFFGLFV